NINQLASRFVLHISPQTTISTIDPACVGVNDGSITLSGASPISQAIISGVGINDSITANYSDTLISRLKSGNYTVNIVFPHGGCEIQQTISIQAPQILSSVSEIISPNCTNCLDGSIELTFFGGSSPYSIIWKGMSESDSFPTLAGLGLGLYTFDVTDANGCKLTDSVELGSVLSIDQNDLRRSNVYPNPANSSVTLKGFTESVMIFSATGQLMQSFDKVVQQNIDVSLWPAGVYFVRSGVEIIKLVVSH